MRTAAPGLFFISAGAGDVLLELEFAYLLIWVLPGGVGNEDGCAGIFFISAGADDVLL